MYKLGIAARVLEPAIPDLREHKSIKSILDDPQSTIQSMKDRYKELQRQVKSELERAETMTDEQRAEAIKAQAKVEQQLRDLDAMSAITAERLEEVGLTELELGCLRLYTGKPTAECVRRLHRLMSVACRADVPGVQHHAP